MADLSTLFDAARKNDVAAVQAILVDHPELAGARTEAGDSAILQAAYYGAKETERRRWTMLANAEIR